MSATSSMVATKATICPLCSRSLAPEVRKALENADDSKNCFYEAGMLLLCSQAIEDQQREAEEGPLLRAGCGGRPGFSALAVGAKNLRF